MFHSLRNAALIATALLSTAGPAAAADGTSAAFAVRTDCGRTARCFPSVQAAVDAAAAVPAGRRVTITIGRGDFNEKVTVERGNLVLVGQGIGRTRIYQALAAEHAGKFHRDNWGTAGSATLTINAADVTVRAMTVENTFDYLTNDALPAGDPRRISNSQAAAVLLDIKSDRVLLDRVSLVGFQDTLFANGNRAYVRGSRISGNIDFIFGNGRLLIEDSDVVTRRRGTGERDNGFESFVAAPSTPLDQDMGIVFHRSRLKREDGVGDGTVALARPWHPTRRFADGRYADPAAVGMALFIDCWMDVHIDQRHWSSMPGTARDGTKTAIFKPQDSRFAEVRSTGPGARRVDIGMKWQPPMTIAAIKRAFFRGWPLR